MVQRRSRGEGALFWDERRQRWTAAVDLGFTAAGKRRRVKVTAKTKTLAKAKLKEKLRQRDDGLQIGGSGYTVGDAVNSWLDHGLVGRDPSTIANRASLARNHVLPALGARRLADLRAEDIDRWLAHKAKTLSTDTLHRLLSILRRSIHRAQARDLVRRNVAELCDVPRGTAGRPSKSLTFAQAEALLFSTQNTTMHAYIVVSLLTGARTEELRALTWENLDLDGDPSAEPPRPPTIQVWRSVRTGGDTKTAKSRRTLELPGFCVEVLHAHRELQAEQKARADRWDEKDLVFTSQVGTELDAANVRRAFRSAAKAAGLIDAEWTPRELRHSFVSLLSSAGMPIEEISHLVGHSSTNVTERIYRKELRPVLTRGARAMDGLFQMPARDFGSQLGSPVDPDVALDEASGSQRGP
jgi:integrase